MIDAHRRAWDDLKIRLRQRPRWKTSDLTRLMNELEITHLREAEERFLEYLNTREPVGMK